MVVVVVVVKLCTPYLYIGPFVLFWMIVGSRRQGGRNSRMAVASIEGRGQICAQVSARSHRALYVPRSANPLSLVSH
jgi:hypothetical protein